MRMDCVIIGAGPAGLTAAWQLAKAGKRAVLFEQDGIVGGISRTDEYKGYRFDIGGHRFFTKVQLVQKLWVEILDEDFMVRPRLSRIYYDGKFFDYPLKPMNALLGLGPVEAVRIGLSYLWAQAFPHREERNFKQWVSNRFGSRLFEIFFETYTEKVWGMPCTEINADWAAQRIKNLDLVSAVKNALLGARTNAEGEVITTLIEQFHYPRLGPGQMWETAARRLAAQGVETHLKHRVESILHDGSRVRSLLVRDASGGVREVTGEHFISSMPVQTLLRVMDPPPPSEVLAAADQLRYRDYLTVVLIVNQPELFPDNWIYIHSPDVKLGRIQNYKNWSPHMVADPSKTALGLEYFVQEGDAYWSASDAELIALGKRETELLGLAKAADVEDGCVIRMPKAYPVYDGDYQAALQVIRKWLEGLPNLHLIGRNGQHRYNNQDHSMVTACYAAENIAAGRAVHDIWDVNVDAEYHEEVRATDEPAATGDRLVPSRVADATIEELVRDAFARYDAVALGAAVGIVAGAGVFLATAALLLRGGENVGANLSLLGNYLAGFEMSWTGALYGLVEVGAYGFGFGWLIARLINFVIAAEEQRIVRQAEELAVDLLEGD
jgi:protoporphyrinogen oxidase